MRKTFRTAALALTLLVPALGWRARTERLGLRPESKLWVEGSSTIRSFTCTAGDVAALVDTKSPNAIPLLLAGDKDVVAVDVKVAVEKLDCGNGTMNEHMLRALNATEHPRILFRLSSYEITRGNGAVTGTLSGTLELGGARKPITVTAQAKPEGEMLRITGSQELLMTDYGLTPPSLMFGRIKVSDKVTVKFDLLLKN
jgi:hypothetical protein